MSDTASAQALMTTVQTLTTVLYVLADVGAAVLVATVVRRHRPDAYGSLLVWAIYAVVLAIVTPLAYALGFAVVGRTGGIERIIHFQALMNVLSTVLHLAVFALLLRGLVKLAQPPKPVTTEPVGPYR